MTTFIEASADERIAALLGRMQARVGTPPASRFDPAVGFGSAEVLASAWHTVARMRAELDDAGTHLRAACTVLARWVPLGAQGRRPPRGDHAPPKRSAS